jgi:cyclopropane-fatty-acyl-phospholipid synthase
MKSVGANRESASSKKVAQSGDADDSREVTLYGRSSMTWWQRTCSKIVIGAFTRMKTGQLKMSLPSGETLETGLADTLPCAIIRINNPEFFVRCVLFGAIGFAEAYIDGFWETDNLTDVVSWFIANLEQSTVFEGSAHKLPTLDLLSIYNRLVHLSRPNSLAKSAANIRAHYDLSNDFFALFLDRSMTYSSALYRTGSESLETAQVEKWDRLCRKLHLKAGEQILEIGSGWGSFALYAAKTYGVKVTTITISKEQFDYVQKRLKHEDVGGRVEIRLCDYRKMEGQFDKIVSIEMVEALGDAYVDVFFEKCGRLLKKDGLLAIQMIITPDCRYDLLRRNVDFIQKHIFPGSLLMSVERVNSSIRKSSDLNLYDLKDFASSYAKTLSTWRDNFNAELENIRAIGFDDSFIRKWNYYFSYCEAAFATRQISVVQVVYARPNNIQICEAERIK